MTAVSAVTNANTKPRRTVALMRESVTWQRGPRPSHRMETCCRAVVGIVRLVPRRRPTSEPPARLRVWALVGLVMWLGVSGGCGGGSDGPPFSVDTATTSPVAGIQDDTIDSSDPTERVRQMAESGAAVIRVELQWSQVAVTRPANPTDPDDPSYQWAPYDRVLDVAAANHVEVLFAVYGTPKWAADPTVTLPKQGVFDFAIRPNDPADFGAFATAAATRFAPRGVRKWEGWNEPNITLFLYPQYERKADRWVATSPRVYSDLQKSFYAGVKAAAPDAVVAGGVTAPNGDRCGTSCRVGGPKQLTKPNRIKADDFLRALDAPGLQPPMDVVSHHPYPATKPRDTTLPNRGYLDLYNLDVLTRTIDRTYLRGKKVWLTEYGFGTEAVPQYPKHFTRQEQATYIVDAFRRLRVRPRVQLMVYYFLHDHTDWKSGLLDINGAPKPGLAAFALPFAVDAVTRKAVRMVGQARAAVDRTEVQIDWKSGDSWRRLSTVDTAADGTFAISVRPAKPVTLRAVWKGRGRSGAQLTWISPEVAVAALTGR